MTIRTTTFEELPELLTPEEVREWLGVSRGMVYELLRRGEIAHVRFGRLIRVPKSSLRRQTPELR